jgi:hypothetical protein
MPPTIIVTVGMLPLFAAALLLLWEVVLPLLLLLLDEDEHAATAKVLAVAAAASATSGILRNMDVLLGECRMDMVGREPGQTGR